MQVTVRSCTCHIGWSDSITTTKRSLSAKALWAKAPQQTPRLNSHGVHLTASGKRHFGVWFAPNRVKAGAIGGRDRELARGERSVWENTSLPARMRSPAPPGKVAATSPLARQEEPLPRVAWAAAAHRPRLSFPATYSGCPPSKDKRARTVNLHSSRTASLPWTRYLIGYLLFYLLGQAQCSLLFYVWNLDHILLFIYQPEPYLTICLHCPLVH